METLSYCQLMERMLAAEARVVELAAENVALKQFPEQIVKFIGGLGTSEMGSDTKEKIGLAANRIKTHATDRIVAAQRSAFVDEAVAKITESGALTFGDCIAALCQLRESAK